MDLYEAIEIVDEWLLYHANPDDEVVEAIKICLEAARDKAGV